MTDISPWWLKTPNLTKTNMKRSTEWGLTMVCTKCPTCARRILLPETSESRFTKKWLLWEIMIRFSKRSTTSTSCTWTRTEKCSCARNCWEKFWAAMGPFCLSSRRIRRWSSALRRRATTSTSTRSFAVLKLALFLTGTTLCLRQPAWPSLRSVCSTRRVHCLSLKRIW